MASLIEELIEVLEDTTGCYEEYLALANNKKDVIINGDAPSLQSLTDKEQSVAGRLLRLEKKRIEILKDICNVTNKDYETIKLTDLIEMLKTQKDLQKSLHKSTTDLTAVLKLVNEINSINKQLLEEAIEYSDIMTNIAKSNHEIIVNNGYEKKGKYNDDKITRTFFDAKQ